MKIRSGFVSNSSSSSFVMVVVKEEFDKARDKQDPMGQALIDFTMEPMCVLGQDCMVYSSFSDAGVYGTFYDVDQYKIINEARRIAKTQGRPILDDPDFLACKTEEEQDDWLSDYVIDELHSVSYYFDKVPDDKKWSHSEYNE